MPVIVILFLLLLSASGAGCSCGGGPLLGDWQSDRAGSVYRFQPAADGTIEAIAISRDADRLVAYYTEDQTQEQRRFWSTGPARECLLRRGELGIVVYRGIRAVVGGFEGESRNRGMNYQAWTGCRVDEEWVRRRLVIRDEMLEVRTLGEERVLTTFHRYDPDAVHQAEETARTVEAEEAARIAEEAA